VWLAALWAGGGGEVFAVVGAVDAEASLLSALNNRLSGVCVKITQNPSDENGESEVGADFGEGEKGRAGEKLDSGGGTGLEIREVFLILGPVDEFLMYKIDLGFREIHLKKLPAIFIWGT